MNAQDIIFLLVNLLPFIFLGLIIKKVLTFEEPEELNIVTIEADVIVHIKEDLFYDPNTFIVYRNVELLHTNDAVLVHYYSPNGYEYRYNSETNTFEEIKEKQNDIHNW